MRKSTTIGAAAMMLTLGACAQDDGINYGFGWLDHLDQGLSLTGARACETAAKKATAAIDWTVAPTVQTRIRQGHFEPATLDFAVGQPVKLRIVNADDARRSFRAPEFFENSAVYSVDVGELSYGPSCFATVRMGPGETAEIWLLPEKDGRYRWHDNGVPFGPVFTRRAGFGTIAVRGS